VDRWLRVGSRGKVCCGVNRFRVALSSRPPLLSFLSLFPILFTPTPSVLETIVEQAPASADEADADYKEAYRGPARSHKFAQLEAHTSYMLRACNVNDVGTGPWSPPLVVTTTETPLSAPRRPKCCPSQAGAGAVDLELGELPPRTTIEIRLRSGNPPEGVGARLLLESPDEGAKEVVLGESFDVAYTGTGTVVTLDDLPVGVPIEVHARRKRAGDDAVSPYSPTASYTRPPDVPDDVEEDDSDLDETDPVVKEGRRARRRKRQPGPAEAAPLSAEAKQKLKAKLSTARPKPLIDPYQAMLVAVLALIAFLVWVGASK